MKLRRESPEAQQIKLIKLCGTAMGTVQSILTLPLEGGDQEAIERMRDSLRAMLHRWSAEQQPEQDEAATSVTTKQGETAATAVPASAVNIDELPPEARARVIAKINVPAASSIASKASEEEPPKPRAKQGKHGLKEDKEEQKQVEAVSAIGTSNG